jgi:hypothetical protein
MDALEIAQYVEVVQRTCLLSGRRWRATHQTTNKQTCNTSSYQHQLNGISSPSWLAPRWAKSKSVATRAAAGRSAGRRLRGHSRPSWRPPRRGYRRRCCPSFIRGAAGGGFTLGRISAPLPFCTHRYTASGHQVRYGVMFGSNAHQPAQAQRSVQDHMENQRDEGGRDRL